jgi:hypothetical protein
LSKSKKKDNAKGASASGSETKASQASASSDDPLDLSQLEDGIAAAVSRLKDDLSKLRVGGRLNPETIEGLRVQLGKDTKDIAKLGELAQVVPKGGRMVTLLVAEESVRLLRSPSGRLSFASCEFDRDIELYFDVL